MATAMEARVRRRLLQRNLLSGTPEEGSEQYEAWTANQTISPLLRLPPELRNRIYELVLTAGIVSVQQRPVTHVWRPQSQQGNAQKSVVAGGFFCRRVDPSRNPYEDARCVATGTAVTERGGGGGSGVTLLAPVSRQLYRETALLPFELNAWCFESAAVLERYVLRERRLAPEQRRALRTLYVDAGFAGGNLAHKCFRELEVLIWCSPSEGTRRTVVLPRRRDDKARALAKSRLYGEAVELFDT